MSGIARRAGIKLANFLERAADPGGLANNIQLYSKDVTGTTHLFAQDSGGTVHQLTPTVAAAAGRQVLSEQWAQHDVAASQSNVDLSAQVSQQYDTWVAIRGGGIIGMATRFTTAITDATADSAIVACTVNGSAVTLQVSHNSGGNASGGQATQAATVDTFVAGDTLGMEITTLGSFAPVTTDLEAYMEIDVS